MEIKIKNIKVDVLIKLDNNEIIQLWNELEHLSDNNLIDKDSNLMKLKIMIKAKIYLSNELLIKHSSSD